MGDYISREKVLEEEATLKDYSSLKFVLVDDIKSIPSADVRENVHGYWKPVDPLQSGDNERFGTYACSVCGTGTYGIIPARWKGCPWCLAVMDGEPKEEK